MRYGFTRGVARMQIALGVVMILAGVVLAAVAFLILPQTAMWSARIPWRDEALTRAVAAVVVFGVGLVIGTALIVGGQLALAFLHIRARLVRIDRRLRSSGAPPERESPLVERLRPRR